MTDELDYSDELDLSQPSFKTANPLFEDEPSLNSQIPCIPRRISSVSQERHVKALIASLGYHTYFQFSTSQALELCKNTDSRSSTASVNRAIHNHLKKLEAAGEIKSSVVHLPRGYRGILDSGPAICRIPDREDDSPMFGLSFASAFRRLTNDSVNLNVSSVRSLDLYQDIVPKWFNRQIHRSYTAQNKTAKRFFELEEVWTASDILRGDFFFPHLTDALDAYLIEIYLYIRTHYPNLASTWIAHPHGVPPVESGNNPFQVLDYGQLIPMAYLEHAKGPIVLILLVCQDTIRWPIEYDQCAEAVLEKITLLADKKNFNEWFVIHPDQDAEPFFLIF